MLAHALPESGSLGHGPLQDPHSVVPPSTRLARARTRLIREAGAVPVQSCTQPQGPALIARRDGVRLPPAASGRVGIYPLERIFSQGVSIRLSQG